MKYPLDVVFFDRSGVVVQTYPDLAPRKRTPWHRQAHYAVELPPGTIGATRTEQGDKLVWLPLERGRDPVERAEENGRDGGSRDRIVAIRSSRLSESIREDG